MNTCIRSTFKCTFEVFKAKVMEDEPNWSRFVDEYQIAKVDDHNSIMLMNVLDFEAMEAFMTTDEMKAWDAEHGCRDTVYSLSLIQQRKPYKQFVKTIVAWERHDIHAVATGNLLPLTIFSQLEQTRSHVALAPNLKSKSGFVHFPIPTTSFNYENAQ